MIFYKLSYKLKILLYYPSKIYFLGVLSMFKFSLLPILTLMTCGCSNQKDEWDKKFPASELVTVKKVEFKNRFGVMLVGDLYTPKNLSGSDNAAIALAGPFGAVKEQVSGLYAQTLAERGFITLAFDASFTGESKGGEMNIASPDINTEDFSAAVDFLSIQPTVNPDKIGIVGICGFGGFALNATAIDTRIKATVTSTMYDMTRVSAYGYNDSVDVETRYQTKVALNAQRTADFKNGSYAKAPALPDELTGNEPQFIVDYYNYYKKPLGFHKRSIASNGAWNQTSILSLMNSKILEFSDEIRSPVLMIHGENAHSRYFSEDAFKKLTGDNKELFIIKGANHTDLYFDINKIPFDKIESFFKDNLK